MLRTAVSIYLDGRAGGRADLTDRAPDRQVVLSPIPASEPARLVAAPQQLVSHNTLPASFSARFPPLSTTTSPSSSVSLPRPASSIPLLSSPIDR
jgi:hypothetical protein